MLPSLRFRALKHLLPGRPHESPSRDGNQPLFMVVIIKSYIEALYWEEVHEIAK